MENNKKPVYLWIVTILVNIGMAFIIAREVRNGDINLLLMGLAAMVSFVFVTVVPILVANSVSRWKNYFGYGTPVLLLLPIVPVLFLELNDCTNEYCGLFTFMVGLALGIPAVIFAFFYFISTHYHKLSANFSIPLLLTIPAFLIGLLWLLGI